MTDITKVESYRKYLNYRFWTISEIYGLLAGFTEFGMHHFIPPLMQSFFGRDRFGLTPSSILAGVEAHELTKNKEIVDRFVDEFIKAIESNQIYAYSFKMLGVDFFSKNGITYFIDPESVIAFALTRGYLLPRELQVAANLYQKEMRGLELTEPQKKQIRREAVVQAFWYKYPTASISDINRRMQKLKNFQGFSYINDSENRSRDTVKKLKPSGKDNQYYIADIIEENEQYVAFDFQKLFITVNAISSLLVTANDSITESEILEYPLIHSYIVRGGREVESIVKFSLMGIFEHLYHLRMQSDN